MSGDGDPHTLIRPETITPRTPTEMLEQILASDEAPTSASTLLRAGFPRGPNWSLPGEATWSNPRHRIPKAIRPTGHPGPRIANSVHGKRAFSVRDITHRGRAVIDQLSELR
jgi:hypothetical protein